MNEYKLKSETEWTQYNPNLETDRFMLETLRSIYGEDSVEVREARSPVTPVNVGPVIASPRHVVDLTNNVDAKAYRDAVERQNNTRLFQTSKSQQDRPKESPKSPAGMSLEQIQAWYYEQARRGLLK